MTNYDPEDNSKRSWELAIKAWREICVRRGQIAPDTPEERQWQQEGPRRPSELSVVQIRGRE